MITTSCYNYFPLNKFQPVAQFTAVIIKHRNSNNNMINLVPVLTNEAVDK